MTNPNAIFIHAAVDDAGLTPAQFRVLCHVGRRGECFESVGNMAARCRLHADTVRRSLKELVRLGWLSRQLRPGTTNIYEVNHLKIREYPLGKGGRGAYEKEVGGAYEKEGGEVYPTKVNPNKDICSSGDERACNSGEREKANRATARDIYEAYPRKQHKGEALKAIEQAMTHKTPAYLLDRTQLYAEVVAGGNKQYIPLPARWFSTGDYESDPAEWALSVNSTWGKDNRPRDAVGRPIEVVR